MNKISMFVLCAAVAACSPPQKTPSEAKSAALDHRTAMRSHLAMCDTTVVVAADNVERVATGKMDAASANQAISQGRTTCEEERAKAIMLVAPDGMPPASQSAYDAMGSSCDQALQGHVDTLDALLKVVDGKGSPSMIDSATANSKDIAKMTGLCRAKLDAAAIGAGASAKDL